MPIFEYECHHCGRRFEEILFRDAEVVHCPGCGRPGAHKLLSSFAVGRAGQSRTAASDGPCPCGAPRRGMCGESRPH